MNLQKISIIGGGPAGLYFVILMHENYPDAEITIYERNRRDDREGWGIVIIQGTVRLLEKCDPDSYNEIVGQCKRCSTLGDRSLKLTDPEFLKKYQDYQFKQELPE